MRRAALLVVLALAAAMLVGCDGAPATRPEGGGGTTTESSPGTSPDGSVEPSPDQGGVSDPAALVNDRCTGCHDLSRIRLAQFDRAGWERTVARMRRNGAQLTDEEAKEVVDFLASGGAEKL